jgi:hypothetical protein
MATNHLMHHCRHCQKKTPHLEPATSHVLHLLLSILTLGLWVPVWILSAIANSSQKTCGVCGKVAGLFG